jgi:shikimate dehydrogenase
MPLKRAVLPLLDRVDPLVTAVGGANTVIFAAAQRLGYNTDVAGMVRALAERGIVAQEPVASSASCRSSPVVPVEPPTPVGSAGAPVTRRRLSVGPALILGGGATACAALAALRDLGERAVTAAVRDPARAEDLRSAADRMGMAIALQPFERASIVGARLIVSTVPAGAADFVAQIFPDLVPVPELVFDVVYHPWPTALAGAARQAGATVIGGFDLLLHQAALQVELMTDRPAPLERMRQAGLAELNRRASNGDG